MMVTKEIKEGLIKSKMKGEVAQGEEEKPKKPVAESMMEALRETAERSDLWRWKMLTMTAKLLNLFFS